MPVNAPGGRGTRPGGRLCWSGVSGCPIVRRMGRPPLGDSGRTKTGSTKLTRREVDELERRYGTVHSGLRAAVDSLLHAPSAGKATKRPKTVKAAVAESPSLPAGPTPQAVAPCRIHRAYKVVDRWFDKGQEWSRKRCADCGTEVVVPDHG